MQIIEAIARYKEEKMKKEFDRLQDELKMQEEREKTEREKDLKRQRRMLKAKKDLEEFHAKRE
jgi:hypothetical protein